MDAPPPAVPSEPDSRNSLRHILASEPAPDKMDELPQINTPGQDDSGEDGPDSTTNSNSNSNTGAGTGTGTGTTTAPREPGRLEPTVYTATTTTTRRNANGSVSSVYSGNKIRHLKKDDGIPLWRKDIQYDFLRFVFEDQQRVFHKVSDKTGGHTFADIYLDAMAKSSKCSKILKDKLLTERPAAINMAMVCLLVNVGRMNTTLNFFPEMRAQLRTYHSIPSLQAHQDPNAYKQLQDAPRLKSILKGATEDVEQPSTVDDIRALPVPRTNPVNLIFVLSQYAPKISETHFFPPRDFFDLVMRSSLSSRSRATAFLWLMWWYLESDFSDKDSLENPYGPGQAGPDNDPATRDLHIKCPPFTILTAEQEAEENVDTEDEKVFGEIKRKERIAILASDMAPVVTGPKRTKQKVFNQNPVFSVIADDGASTPSKDRNQSPSHGSARGRGKLAKTIIEREYPSDTDRTRSASPSGSVYNTATKKGTPNMRINTLLNDDAPSSTPMPSRGPGRGNWSRNRKAKLEAQTLAEGASPATQNGPSSTSAAGAGAGPHGFYLPLNGSEPSHKRTRPLTQHQLAVEQYRRRRVEVILDRGIRVEWRQASKRRKGRNRFVTAWLRSRKLSEGSGYDTDEESGLQELRQMDIEVGVKTPPPVFAGLTPCLQAGELNDYGEEAYTHAKLLSRVMRRLDRWEGGREAIRTKDRGKNDAVWAATNGADRREDLEDEGDVDEDVDEEMRDIDDEGGRDEESGESEDEEEPQRYDLPPLSSLA